MSDAWAAVVTSARKSVVQIRTLTSHAFDGNTAGPTLGSGFIVDKKLGIIMTNRHVISTAPVRLEVVFLNDEEIEAEPLYIDPLHDFGFCRIDPQKVKYMTVEELTMKPDRAKSGVEVRVVGSDAGEKTMVLRGTISRTDRTPPEYEPGSGFADHNTFYITASCDTSGGSSGSPVLDKTGTVIALNAGAAMDAASSFFLPIDRAVKALEVIRKCLSKGDYAIQKALPRGTLQCVFTYIPMSECTRLGITKEEEKELRQGLKIGTHLLVVEQTIPKGPADKAGLAIGDILLKVNGKYLNQFQELEDILDAWRANPSKHELALELKRGAEIKKIENIKVSDAYEAVPDSFLSFSSGIIHRVGFSTALDFRVPWDSVVVEEAGYAFTRAALEKGCVIRSVEGEPVKTLEDLEKALASRKDGENVLVRATHLFDKCNERLLDLDVDRKWYPMSMCRRDPKRFGEWNHTPSPLIPATPGLAVENNKMRRPASFRVLKASRYTSEEEKVLRALVLVRFSAPYPIDGIYNMNYFGTGYICSKEHGLVVTDRNTVISLLGDCTVEVGFAYKLKAKVLFLHPFQNFAIIQYNPAELGETEVEELELFDASMTSERDLKHGDELNYFGFSQQQHFLHLTGLKVVGMERGTISTTGVPRFAAKNFDQLKLEKLLPPNTIGGIFVDAKGRGRAFNASYAVDSDENEIYANSLSTQVARAVKAVVDWVESGNTKNGFPPYYSLACEYGVMPLKNARYGMKLPEVWAAKLRAAADESQSGAGSGTREVLYVRLLLAGTTPTRSLEIGDLMLAADGVTLVSYDGFEQRALEAGKAQRDLTVTVLRRGEVIDVKVKPAAISCTSTMRIVTFAGMLCQDTHDAVRWLGYLPKFMLDRPERKGAFVNSTETGSPAHRNGLPPGRWVTEINETPIEDLDDLVKFAKQMKHGDMFRVRTVGLHGDEAVTMHELDLKHFPTSEIAYKQQEGDWELMVHSKA